MNMILRFFFAALFAPIFAAPSLSAANADATYTDLQSKVLKHYGVRASSRYVEIKEPRMRVHYLKAGSGKPMVVIHGGDGEAWNWAPLLAVLQRTYTVYAVDRPGFGQSDRFDYSEVDIRRHAGNFLGSFLDALKLKQVIVVGGSMGGYFAMCGAIDHPGRVDRLVLVGMPFGVMKKFSEGWKALATGPGAAEKLVDRISTPEGLRWQYREMFNTDPANVPDLYFQARVAGLNRPGAKQTWVTLIKRTMTGDETSPWAYV